jgi:predicted enzyme related to lactoylglutathione lyase
VEVELTDFPAGGAMLDIRRRDGRLFVMSYSPSHGFGVDEVGADDGFIPAYRFVSSDFDPAAKELRRLVAGGQVNGQSNSPIALNLVVIYSRDIEAAKEFYERLGLSFRPEKHGKGPSHFAAELGSAVLELFPCRDPSHVPGTRIGLVVPSVDQAVNQLRGGTTEVVTEPHESAWGRRAVVKDVDGNFVELTQSA